MCCTQAQKLAEKCEAKPKSGLKARGEQLVLKLYLMRPVCLRQQPEAKLCCAPLSDLQQK